MTLSVVVIFNHHSQAHYEPANASSLIVSNHNQLNQPESVRFARRLFNLGDEEACQRLLAMWVMPVRIAASTRVRDTAVPVQPPYA
jgi:hypothetical protein